MIVVSDFLPLGDDLVCRWARIAEERVCDEGEECADEDCEEDAVHFEKGNPAAGNVRGEVLVMRVWDARGSTTTTTIAMTTDLRWVATPITMSRGTGNLMCIAAGCPTTAPTPAPVSAADLAASSCSAIGVTAVASCTAGIITMSCSTGCLVCLSAGCKAAKTASVSMSASHAGVGTAGAATVANGATTAADSVAFGGAGAVVGVCGRGTGIACRNRAAVLKAVMAGAGTVFGIIARDGPMFPDIARTQDQYLAPQPL